MELFEAKREGYIQALNDLHNDGLLSLEEFKKREQEQMAKSYVSPLAPNNTTSQSSFFGGQMSGKDFFGGAFSSPPSFNFGSSADPSPSLASFDLRANSNVTTTPNDSIPTSGNQTTTAFESAENAQRRLPSILESIVPESEVAQIPLPIGSTIPQFKITLIGDGAVGKTVWVNLLKTRTFERQYIATVGGNVTPLVMMTNNGPVKLNICDAAGQEKFSLMRDSYYLGTDGFILMFDVTNRTSYKNVPNFYAEAKRERENQPVVLVGNKVDVPNHQVKERSITYHRKKNLQYYAISVRKCLNIEKPFLHLLRVLMGDPNLSFVSASNSVTPTPPVLEELQSDVKQSEPVILPD